MQHGDKRSPRAGAGDLRAARTLANVLKAEATAYLRAGLLAPGGVGLIREGTDGIAELGVIFVPGVGANASQFTALKEALSGVAEWFDAFEYWNFRPAKEIARALHEHVERMSARADRILLVGHSMGGLLCRAVLQDERPLPTVAGFVSICAPLHGTWRAKLAPNPLLRALAPDSKLLEELYATADRLAPLKATTLNIGVRYDSFVSPFDSAFLEGYEHLVLEDTGHVAALFDERVHGAVRALARRLKR